MKLFVTLFACLLVALVSANTEEQLNRRYDQQYNQQYNQQYQNQWNQNQNQWNQNQNQNQWNQQQGYVQQYQNNNNQYYQDQQYRCNTQCQGDQICYHDGQPRCLSQNECTQVSLSQEVTSTFNENGVQYHVVQVDIHNNSGGRIVSLNLRANNLQLRNYNAVYNIQCSGNDLWLSQGQTIERGQTLSFSVIVRDPNINVYITHVVQN